MQDTPCPTHLKCNLLWSVKPLGQLVVAGIIAEALIKDLDQPEPAWIKQISVNSGFQITLVFLCPVSCDSLKLGVNMAMWKKYLSMYSCWFKFQFPAHHMSWDKQTICPKR